MSASTLCGAIFDYAAKRDRLAEVDAELERPDIWSNPERAQSLGRERARLEDVIRPLERADSGLRDAGELLELAAAEDDAATAAEVQQEVAALARLAGELEFKRMFSGEMDGANAFVDIQSGTGGTEAQDWAAMLLRMYLRFCADMGFSTEILEQSAGEVAGIKSASFYVQGPYAYGWLRTEIGVHRLVRKSPFDSNARRHTSFAAVFVSPEVDDSIKIEINPADLKVDTYRSGGAGGQHVNKTESAIRITHLPSGIVVECQDERSQHKNRARAMALLRARLLDAERGRQQKEMAATRKKLVGTGDRSERIRTYNFPQGRLTDHRINLTLYQLESIVEGGLAPVIGALLAEHQAEQLAEIGDAA